MEWRRTRRALPRPGLGCRLRWFRWKLPLAGRVAEAGVRRGERLFVDSRAHSRGRAG